MTNELWAIRYREAIAKLGLDFGQLAAMDAADRFTLVTRAIGAIEEPAERLAMACQVFGKSAPDLPPTLHSCDACDAPPIEFMIKHCEETPDGRLTTLESRYSEGQWTHRRIDVRDEFAP